MLKIQPRNHHFRLNIATDKSTSLDLRKIGLWFKTHIEIPHFLQNKNDVIEKQAKMA